MNHNLSLVLATDTPLPVFSIAPEARQAKELALAGSALIGKVTNGNENELAVSALAQLKGLSDKLERDRRKFTEPLLEAQRQLKRATDAERDELDRERGRLELLIKDFVKEEKHRVREEELAQQQEVDRIEREKLAALAQATSPQEAETIREQAESSARVAARPVAITRAVGQTNRRTWVIQQINDFQLLRARPDLVRKIEWDIVGIKEILSAGGTLPGVVAAEDLRVTTRTLRVPQLSVMEC